MRPKFNSIVDSLRSHASTDPDREAYILLDEREQAVASLTFAELDRRASILAGNLAARTSPGDRALLLFPTDLWFIVSFFACQYAGVIAVPMKIPLGGASIPQASASIISDCRPKLILTATEFLEDVKSLGSPVGTPHRIDVDAVDWCEPHLPTASATPFPETLSFLQYTSGSTAQPKGVMVTHGNLCANLEMISIAYELSAHSTRVSWIPLFHDMGMVLGALQATYVGALCVLMDPSHFIRRPMAWLRGIHKYQAEMSVAPNFAYELCCDCYSVERMKDVDLSCWKLALNGSEPVRESTLRRFAEVFSAHGLSPAALHPAYGLAEATLMVSGGWLGRDCARLWKVSKEALKCNRAVPAKAEEAAQTVVGCGRTLQEEEIAIVDPATKKRVLPGNVGEIWVSGPNVALGYWRKPDATSETFRSRIAGEPSGAWLRTGDLGCLDDTHQLYIVGRIKDVIVLRGSNYYPQDIELTVERCHRAIRPSYGAAFTVPQVDREVLVVVFEVRTNYVQGDIERIVGMIRSAVTQEHGLTVHHVTLVPPRSIPKTTSGKVRRSMVRNLWCGGQFNPLNRSDTYERIQKEYRPPADRTRGQVSGQLSGSASGTAATMCKL
jgi:acyl-CoA synthetase (AMP-forming)/AMP-acid ligase II